jgi:hypothetical protein
MGEQESERPFSKRNYEKARAQQVIITVDRKDTGRRSGCSAHAGRYLVDNFLD